MNFPKFRLSNEVQVGLFALAVIIILALVTIRVGDQSIVAGGAYELKAIFKRATGLYPKASVEVAGVDVGIVKKIELTPEGRAMATLGISKEAKIPKNSQIILKIKGFLGEAFIDIVPGDPATGFFEDGDVLGKTDTGGDVTGLVNQFNVIGKDVETITKQISGWVDEEKGGEIAVTVKNLEEFTRVLREVTIRNEENMDRILQNMADLTHEIKTLVEDSREDIDRSAAQIASITQKIDEGRGTIGKLINDPKTVDKLNESLDSLNDALGGYRKMELGLGFHTEYLNASNDFKNYVSVQFKPSPDEALLLDLISDQTPDTQRVRKIADVTAGGTTTRVTTETETLDRDKLLFSAQLAKRFYDFTLRGGLIESKGGVGLDYGRGPMGVSFSAFDFETRFNEKPHLKVMGTVSVIPNVYLLGGMDDPLNPAQKTDYFVGAGFRIVDEEVKSLLGLSKLR